MLNVSFKSPLCSGGGMCMYPSLDYGRTIVKIKMMVSTSAMNNITSHLGVMSYQTIHRTSQRTGVNETKAYPTIRICRLTTLTGDCLSWNARKSYAKDAEYPIWQRNLHSSPRQGKPATWRREVVVAF